MSDYQRVLKAWQAGPQALSAGGAMPESFRIRPALKQSPEHIAALECLRDWTRARFGLPEADTVLVAEVACASPGCPPLETVVAFWNAGGERHQFKIFKPVEEVVPDDLPPCWMKSALLDDEDSGFTCC